MNIGDEVWLVTFKNFRFGWRRHEATFVRATDRRVTVEVNGKQKSVDPHYVIARTPESESPFTFWNSFTEVHSAWLQRNRGK